MAKNSFMTRFNREQNDFYPTPAFATKHILDREDLSGGLIWECACGEGDMSEAIKAYGYTDVRSTDFIDRGYGEIRNLDFLSSENNLKATHIITNPPFKDAKEFVEKALECTTGKVILLLRLAFLESTSRYELFKSTPLKTIYVYSKRLNFYPGGNDEGRPKSGMIPFAWFVWEHGYTGKPFIDWIME